MSHTCQKYQRVCLWKEGRTGGLWRNMIGLPGWSWSMTEQLRTVETETKRSCCTPYALDSVAYVQQPGPELTQVMGMLQNILGLIA
jgi:hypothetical protein